MFRSSRKLLGSLACAAVLAGANSNVKVEAGAFSRITSVAVGTLMGVRSVLHWCQWFGVARDNKAGDNKGLLGPEGTIGQFDNVTLAKGDDGSYKGLVVPIGETVMTVGSVAAAVIG